MMKFDRLENCVGYICFVAAMTLVCLGSSLTHADDNTAKAANKDEFNVTVQSLEKVEKVKYDWGWIRWMMNSKVNPDSQMTFGVVEIEPNQRNPLHGHSNCEEILFVVSGSCEHRVGERVDLLRAGDMIRIPAGAPHMARTLDEPMRAIIVYSSGERQFEVLDEGPASQ
jgi:quercetin dioxygenase-like cupin family protein